MLILLWRIQGLHLELDSTEFDDIAFAQFIILVMIIRLRVPHHNKHLLVVIGIRVVNARRFGVIFYYVMSLRNRTSLQRKHWSRCLTEDVVSRDQLNLVSYEYDLASSVGLDILLLYILALVVKQAMRISRPGYAPHVNFKYRLRLLLLLGLIHELLDHLMMLLLHRYELI